MSGRLLGYIVFEPECRTQISLPPKGKAVGDPHPTARDAAEYIVDHEKIGAWRICRLVDRVGGPRWERLSNDDEREKGRIYNEAERPSEPSPLESSSVRLAREVVKAIRERQQRLDAAITGYEALQTPTDKTLAAQRLLSEQAAAERAFQERTDIAAMRMLAADQEHVVEEEAAA